MKGKLYQSMSVRFVDVSTNRGVLDTEFVYRPQKVESQFDHSVTVTIHLLSMDDLSRGMNIRVQTGPQVRHCVIRVQLDYDSSSWKTAK